MHLMPPRTRCVLLVTLTVVVFLPLLFSVLLVSCRSSLNGEGASYDASAVEGTTVVSVVQGQEGPEPKAVCYPGHVTHPGRPC